MFGRSYCGICGVRVEKNQAPERFGKHFCSEEHAQQFVQEVQRSRQMALAKGGRNGDRDDRGCCC